MKWANSSSVDISAVGLVSAISPEKFDAIENPTEKQRVGARLYARAKQIAAANAPVTETSDNDATAAPGGVAAPLEKSKQKKAVAAESEESDLEIEVVKPAKLPLSKKRAISAAASQDVPSSPPPPSSAKKRVKST